MKRAQQPSTVDPFAAARVQFEEMLRHVGGAKAPEHHAEIEDAIDEAGKEVHRLVLQGRLDQMFAAEAGRFRKRRPAGQIRERNRKLESRFGRVVVRRHGVRRAGETTSRFPLDERLGLPKELYSLGLRRLIAAGARGQAWEQAAARVDPTTGGHVPKRQAEELVARAAQNFDGYYAERLWSETANDTATSETLLVMSCDGKGIAMRPEALREATRKQAEQAQRDEPRGDPTEVRNKRRHTKRMVTATAVWDQEPCERSADDIVLKLRDEGEAEARVLPRPKHKRVAASVEKSLAEGVAELFDEADRRDPGRERPSVMLIDGAEYQAEVVLAEAEARGRDIIVLCGSPRAAAGGSGCRSSPPEGGVGVGPAVLLGAGLGIVSAGGDASPMRRRTDATRLIIVPRLQRSRRSRMRRAAKFLPRCAPPARCSAPRSDWTTSMAACAWPRATAFVARTSLPS